jgi:hypothetical protein
LLALRLESNGTILSENEYDVTVATSAWSAGSVKELGHVVLFDPYEQAPKILREKGIRTLATLASLQPGQSLVLAGSENVLRISSNMERLRRFVENVWKILLLNAGESLPEMFPQQIKGYRKCEGEIATMHVPESPIFDGIEPLDLSWFELGKGKLPRVCRGTYLVDSTQTDTIALVEVVDLHGYLKKPEDVIGISGSPLVELRIGQGIIFASEMMFEAASDDPIAAKLLNNIVGNLQ